MSDRWVTVRAYPSLTTAEIACAKLIAFGVLAVVPDRLSAGILGAEISGAAGVRLQVPESQLEAAHRLLEPEGAEPEAKPHTLTPELCRTCGSALEPSSRWSWRWPLARPRRSRRCRICGRDPCDFA